MEPIVEHLARSDGKSTIPANIAIESSHEMLSFSAQMTPVVEQIVSRFGLYVMFTPEFWVATVSREDVRADDVVLDFDSLLEKIKFFRDELPTVIDLLSEHRPDVRESIDSSADSLPGDLIDLILPEPSGEASAAERITSAIEGITKLYSAMAVVAGVEGALVLASCDSGSDKVFVFRGTAAAVGEVRKLLLELWDRIAHFGERKLSARLKVALESLTVLDKIGDLEKSGKLSKDQADLARHNILIGGRAFVGAGAQTSDMRNRVPPHPDALLKPQEKFLLPAPEVEQVEHRTAPERPAESPEAHKPLAGRSRRARSERGRVERQDEDHVDTSIEGKERPAFRRK
jgi:hypothetical protein